ncbi:ribonuclease III [Acetivibrio sp. MSJd-27]|uniref:ribonuclease III n=1 Tax=Acetivibrio sp. MSJd-27 TaxID=2841523 RepID=UPI001C0F44E8|nr:ribonuclease III [Acetivibrio sp. MSJd-27]MBU5450441.1 ribonuclease III [Acetivibrio sp. MSJd-27]
MLEKLESHLGYVFHDKKLLKNALTHRSLSNISKGIYSNERLEFLGDAVLGLSVASYLYANCPHLPEGELTKIRALVVCEDTLFLCAKDIGLGSFLLLGKGEEMTHGRQRPSILSDALEAVFAAVYLDGGLENAQKIILKMLVPHIKKAIKERDKKDHKTVLQEMIQSKFDRPPIYVLVNEKGPDHEKVFTVEVCNHDKVLGIGEGKSKKEAEKKAAQKAIELLQK